MIYSTERSLSEYRDKLPQNIIDAINAAIADLRGVMESENAGVSDIWDDSLGMRSCRMSQNDKSDGWGESVR